VPQRRSAPLVGFGLDCSNLIRSREPQIAGMGDHVTGLTLCHCAAKGAVPRIAPMRSQVLHPLVRVVIGLAPFLACSSPAWAQQRTEDVVHWAYAAFFGTGRYEVRGSEDVYVLSYEPRWELRPPARDPAGRRRPGISLRFPVSVGVHELNIDNALDTGNVRTVSAVPGVDFELPMSDRWSLRPVLHAGYGSQTGGGSSAWIYWTGLRSELKFGHGDLEWALVNALTYVGYSADSGPDGDGLPLLTGFEFQRPLGDKKIGGSQVMLHWHAAYTTFLKDLDFQVAGLSEERLDLPNQWELGVAFGKRAEPLRLWRLSWDRVGVAYRFSSNENFKGVSLTFRSLFDR